MEYPTDIQPDEEDLGFILHDWPMNMTFGSTPIVTLFFNGNTECIRKLDVGYSHQKLINGENPEYLESWMPQGYPDLTLEDVVELVK